MLVLARKLGEKIIIGDDIVITIARVDSRGVVRVGIEAPKHIPVHREEVYNRTKITETNDERGGNDGR